jgi:hypothetical protein
MIFHDGGKPPFAALPRVRAVVGSQFRIKFDVQSLWEHFLHPWAFGVEAWRKRAKARRSKDAALEEVVDLVVGGRMRRVVV